jgi:signal transduction histidine kinase
LPALLALAINVSLIVIVLLDNFRSHPHRLFALLIACFALWDIADILVVSSVTPEQASLGGGIIVTALVFATTFFLNISFLFPRPVQSRHNQGLIQILSFAIALTFSVLSALGIIHPLALQYFEDRHFYCYALSHADTISGALLFLIVITCLALGIRNLLGQLRSARFHRERRQIQFFLYGTIVFGLLVAVLDLLHDYEMIHFYFSRALFLVLSISFAYVVLANRLLVVHKILKHGVVYSIVAGLMFGFYILVVQGLAKAIKQFFGTGSVSFEIIAILLFSFLLWPLANAVQTLLDHLFYQHIFHYRDKFIVFTREMFSLTGITDLAKSVDTFLKQALRVSTTQMLVHDVRSNSLRGILDPSLTIPVDSVSTALVAKEHRLFEIGELLEHCSDDERLLLQEYDGGVLLGLFAKKGINGLLLIGSAVNHRAYSLDEMQFLTVFTNEVSMAVERNMVLQHVKEEEAKSLQMEKLAAMGRLTAGIAHEFRNPLSIIKTSAQTILRNVDEREVVQETGRYIVSETERLDSIVGTFLQFAKPHTPVWESTDLSGLFDRVNKSLEQRAASNDVIIRSKVEHDVPELVTSSRHVERALINLGLNALESMSAGGVLTFSVMKKDVKSVLISVQDTGPGIPQEIQARIFDPFFTTKPTGTGLGLAIVYMMVQNIKGSISFTSGSAGTLFSIELPIDGAV